MNRLWLCSIACTLCIPTHAQQHTTWESYIEQNALSEEVESTSLEDLYDELAELAASPINLNTATREQLEQLPFLTTTQINDLMQHLYRVGAIRTWGELIMADVIDPQTLRLLQSFTYLGEVPESHRSLSWQQLAHYGKHETVAYCKIPCYERRGDTQAYLGQPYKHWLRYTYSYGQDVKVGVVGAQDAGEPFFRAPNGGGYDYYSFFVQLRNRRWLRSLVVGRYRIRLGAGLVLNTNYRYGKLTALDLLTRTSTQLTGHSSRSEANYLQGAAATFALSRHIDLTAFASHRAIDATLNADSTTVATLLRTGYHRTQSEIDRKHNTRQTLAGAHTALHYGALHVGLTALYPAFDRPLAPATHTLYRRHAPSGSHFYNLGISYAYTSGRFSMSGETATDDHHAVATLNQVSFTPTSRLSLMAVQRFYSYRYHALFGRSFGENTEVTNESGIYIAARWHAARHLQLTAYTDYAYFPWPRYGTSQSSHSWDHSASALYTRGRLTWQLRYRVKTRQQDNPSHTALISHTTHRLQTYLNTRWGSIEAKTQAQVVYSRHDTDSWGYTVGQQLGYRHGDFHLWGSLSYFHTHDYDSRIYSYERGMRYTFSYPSFYGHGIRYTLLATVPLARRLTLTAKAGITDYFDRDHISSGQQQIDRSSQTDIELQLRMRF